ncbi:hypothetical protein HBI56_187860 [Parastagonospora nodorum]|uniref:Uncharacterized protein n=1 Tax=Phaeosphaeria nodorum (strain SN15 / ATCC MYA-4574 / FGSC 10173) TaxID=321614 RepID=A0A7U2IAS8_PHANO|nr:hypothetical protein HBH56_161660 [Parastagonospora nodorum]QRD06351.1 hypothetical protein JI435_423250 [Parastagonospora nodorum SN15]KAH3932156.1 hypothetical protein HBH54_087580 [Parastagonospora nodorum]KAH3947453.1 hypothetical protein HBH53_114810 [Parastagonospora nodorum]KAH3972887.1 hypothetical protein HBH51_102240 [Parastagonospora nodorum]
MEFVLEKACGTVEVRLSVDPSFESRVCGCGHFPRVDVRPLQHLADQQALRRLTEPHPSAFTSASTFPAAYYVILKARASLALSLARRVNTSCSPWRR